MLRFLVGVYADEIVCYREARAVGAGTLIFRRGSETPLSATAASEWAIIVAETLRSRSDAPLHLIGHAEPTEAPTKEAAIALSNRRAETAAGLLRAHGVSPDQLRLVAHGLTDSALPPLGEEKDEAQIALLRRVYVTTSASADPNEPGSSLIRRSGDKRPLLRWILDSTRPDPLHPGTAPFEVGHHVPRLTIQTDAAAAARLGVTAKTEGPRAAQQPVDTRQLMRFLMQLSSNGCDDQIPPLVKGS